MPQILAVIAILFVLSNAAWAEDLHSVDTIRQALAMPIPPTILQTAKQFDDQIVLTRKAQGQPVTIVNDARHIRAAQIVERLSSAFSGGVSRWTVRVLDTNPRILNAFTAGGNYIYIYTGLLDGVRSDDELAFVVGHEMSHALLKHGFRSSQDTGNLAAAVIEIAGSFSKNTNTKQAAALIGGTIKGTYSREDEREADALSGYISSQAGYDPSRAIDFFRRSITEKNASTARDQQQLATRRNVIEAQIANCNALTTQWNTQPQMRTPQNQIRINAVCDAVRANADEFGRVARQYGTEQITSIFTRTHPVDNERIQSIYAEASFLKGTRPLESLARIGQGYNVLLAINARPIMPGGTTGVGHSSAESDKCTELENRARQLESWTFVSATEKAEARDIANRCDGKKGQQAIAATSSPSSNCAELEARAKQFAAWDFASVTEKTTARDEENRCKTEAGDQHIAAATSNISSNCSELEVRARQFESWDFVSAAEKIKARRAANQCRVKQSVTDLGIVSEKLCQPATHAKLPVMTSLSYHKARKSLLAAGWQPYRTKAPFEEQKAHSDISYGNGAVFWKKGYIEVENCAGTGVSPCSFLFEDAYGNRLRVTTAGEEDENSTEKNYATVTSYKLVCQ